MENTDNFLSIKKRYQFLFIGLSIDEFRLICAKREKTELDNKIKIIKARIRREKRKEKIWNMAQSMQDEINDYLLKASKPKNDFEKMLVDKMTKELGTVTSVKELSLFLKINKNSIYRGMDTGEILSFRSGRRRFIVTEGIIPFLRD